MMRDPAIHPAAIMILAGASVVVALSLPKNSLASTPLSTTDQPSKNNDGNDNNMNSTTDTRETAHTFDPINFTVVPARTFEDLHVGEIFRAPSRTLTDAHASAFQAVSASITLFTTTWSMRGVTDTHSPGSAWLAGTRVHGSRGNALSSVHRRRVHRVYRGVLQVSQGSTCRRHALSCSRDCCSHPAGS